MTSFKETFAIPDVNRYCTKYSKPKTKKKCVFNISSAQRKNDSPPPYYTKNITFNTLVKKRNTLSAKSGTPVAFLSSSSRFNNYEKSCNAYKVAKD